MNLRYIYLFFYLALSINAVGQKSDRGFKNLEKNDIIKAQESFTKALEDDSTNCAVNLGMAIVLSHPNHAAADYFKAWDYFLLSKKNISKLTEDDNVTLKSFFTLRDAERRNKSIQYNIDVEEKIIEDKLIKFVREENKLEVAEHFIAVYPNSKFYENVVHIRNHLEFRKAEKANTVDAYTTFLKKYPDAAQKEEAHKALNELAFQQAKKTNTVEAFDDFIKKFPEAYHYYDAIKLRDQLAFDLTKKQNTIEAFDKFLAKYPSSLHVPAAKVIQRKLLFEKAKQVNTLNAYNDFILRYPEGEFFVDIFNLKTNVLGQNMLAQAQGNKEMVKWIKGFDSELKNDSAGGISLTQDNRVIVSGTRNKLNGTEAWVISLDNEGKTLWNKSFGSMPQNRVKFQVVTHKGDILLGGWSSQTVDTFARKAWLFEISNAGAGKWERNIDGKEANAVSYTPAGEVYVAGYSATDSLPVVPFLMKLNNNYEKLWSREYIRSGTLSSFAATGTQNLIMGEGNWIWKTDPLGYIVWEKLLPVNDSIIAVNSSISGSFYLTGARNNSPYIAKVNDLGVISWEKNFSNMTGMYFDYATLMADKSIFVRYQGNGNVGFMSLSDKGEILKDLIINNAWAHTCNSIAINASGEIFSTFTKGNSGNSEIIVCKIITK